mgnify:CR=1 FL=1
MDDTLINDQKLSNLGRELNRHPFFFCVPIQLTAQESGKNESFSGTLTLLRIDEGKNVGVTCYHVIDKYIDLLGADSEAILVIAGVKFDGVLDRLIDHSVSNDIAIIDLSDFPPLKDIGLGITPQFCEPPRWPPYSLAEEQVTTLGGFPGQWRIEKGKKHFEYATFGIAGELVSDVRDTSFKVSLVDDRHLKTDLGHKTFNDLVHYGGLSGCPVFVQRELFVEIVGIVREGGDLFFEATRLDVFDSNYRIFKFPEATDRPLMLG